MHSKHHDHHTKISTTTNKSNSKCSANCSFSYPGFQDNTTYFASTIVSARATLLTDRNPSVYKALLFLEGIREYNRLIKSVGHRS